MGVMMTELVQITEDEIDLLRRVYKESRGGLHNGLDVFSTKDERTIATLTDKGLVSCSRSFHSFGQGFGSTYVATELGRAVWEQKLFALAAAA